MASYPASIPTFTDPTAAQKLGTSTPKHSTQHSLLNAELGAALTALGTNPQGTGATLVARLSTADSILSAASSQAGVAFTTATAAFSLAGVATSNAATALSTAQAAYTTGTAAFSLAGVATSNAGTALSTAQAAYTTATAGFALAGVATSNAAVALTTATAALALAGVATSNAAVALTTATAGYSLAGVATSNAAVALSTATAALSLAGVATSNAATALSTAQGAIPKSLGSSKGQIIVFTASGTPIALGASANGYALVCDSTATAGFSFAAMATGSGSGDVVGPASSTDKELARFSGSTGKSIQGSSVILTDTGILNLPATGQYQINGTDQITLCYTTATAAFNLAGVATSNAAVALSTATAALSLAGVATSNAAVALTTATAALSLAGVATSNAATALSTAQAAIPKSIGSSKGQLIAFTASGTPVAIGASADGTALICDATSASGFKFATVSGSGATATRFVIGATVPTTSGNAVVTISTITAPYSVVVQLYNQSGTQIIPDSIIATATQFTVNVYSYLATGTLAGTFGGVYIV